jgi:hypothetical protein
LLPAVAGQVVAVFTPDRYRDLPRKGFFAGSRSLLNTIPQLKSGSFSTSWRIGPIAGPLAFKQHHTNPDTNDKNPQPKPPSVSEGLRFGSELNLDKTVNGTLCKIPPIQELKPGDTSQALLIYVQLLKIMVSLFKWF